MQRNLKFTFSYDGSSYCGWQRQKGELTVPQAGEESIERLTGQPIKLVCAGRTDAGVHAIGQVASGRTAAPIPLPNFLRGLQSHLPRDVVIQGIEEVSPNFHARFSAKRKRYRYILHDSPVRLPMLAKYVGWYRKRLNEAAMQEAANVLLGENDFASFGSHLVPNQPTRRTMHSVQFFRMSRWQGWHTSPGMQFQETSQDDDFLCFEIVGDGFLYNMVRTIVGTLIHVGRGRWTVDDMKRIVDARDRSVAGETAAAAGLYLVSVDYPDIIPDRPAVVNHVNDPETSDD